MVTKKIKPWNSGKDCAMTSLQMHVLACTLPLVSYFKYFPLIDCLYKMESFFKIKNIFKLT